MKNKADLHRYINFKRQEGLTDHVIFEILRRRGWSLAAIEFGFQRTRAPQSYASVPIVKPLATTATITTRLNVRKRFFRLSLLLALALISGWIYVLASNLTPSAAQKDKAESATTVKDSNWSLTLPPNWLASNSYSKGGGVSTFRLAGSTSSDRDYLVVLVLPKEPGRNFDSRIVDQLKGLQLNSQITIISDEINVSYQSDRFVELLTPSSAETTYRFLYSLEANEKFYNIDVKLSASTWQADRQKIVDSIRSFKPLDDRPERQSQ